MEQFQFAGENLFLHMHKSLHLLDVVDKYVHFKDDNQDNCLITNSSHFKSGKAGSLPEVLGSFLIEPAHF